MSQISFTAKIDFNGKEVLKRVRVSNHNPLRQAAGFTRKIARQQIKYRADFHDSSSVGTPPHTHPKGKYGKINMMLKNSIVYDVEQGYVEDIQVAVVGTSANIADKIGKIHEFGNPFVTIIRKEYAGVWSFPPRPFMAPALQKSLPYLPKFWEGTLR